MAWKYDNNEATVYKNDRVNLTATRTNNSTTAADITEFSFSLAPFETVNFEFDLTVTGGTGGDTFKFTGPTSVNAFRQTYFGNSTAVTAVTAGTTTTWSSGASTATGAVMNNATPFTGYVRIMGSVTNGATSGTVQLQHANASGTDTMSVLVGSTMTIARR